MMRNIGSVKKTDNEAVRKKVGKSIWERKDDNRKEMTMIRKEGQ